LGWEKWSHFPPEILPAHVAEMDFGTDPAIVAALQEAATGPGLGYLSSARAEGLSQACAAYQADHFGWAVDPAQVRLVTDIMRAAHLAVECFTPPGSPIAVPTPTYYGLITTPGELGRERIDVPLIPGPSGPTFDEAGLRGAIGQGARLILLCSPHNPVGRVWRREDLAILERVVADTGVLVFSDEVHSPLVYPGHRHIPFASLSEVAAAHTITAVSAAKGWNMPGLKCAQMVLTNPQHLLQWHQLGLADHASPSTLGVLANQVAYTQGQAWLNAVLHYLRANRDWLADELTQRAPHVGFTPPEGTYLAWLDLRRLGFGREATEPERRRPGRYLLEQAKVALTDGAAWGTGGAGFVRLNFATSRTLLGQILDRLVEALA
jgi:cystathionine beta-lyase